MEELWVGIALLSICTKCRIHKFTLNWQIKYGNFHKASFHMKIVDKRDDAMVGKAQYGQFFHVLLHIIYTAKCITFYIVVFKIHCHSNYIRM